MPAVECYIGEIKLWPSTKIPSGWAVCAGQVMPIAGNEALFTILGISYGGDGSTTFRLPDLRGRVPVGMGQQGSGRIYQLGDTGGTEDNVLDESTLPIHSHGVTTSGGGSGGIPAVTSEGTTNTPSPSVCLAKGSVTVGRDLLDTNIYSTATPNTTIKGQSFSGTIAIEDAGGSQPFTNMQPYNTLTYIIALEGLYPSPD